MALTGCRLEYGAGSKRAANGIADRMRDHGRKARVFKVKKVKGKYPPRFKPFSRYKFAVADCGARRR